MPDINKLEESIETIQKYCNITPCNECLIESAIKCGKNNSMQQPMTWDSKKVTEVR